MTSEQKHEKATVESIGSKKLAKGVFVLPNLITSAGLFAGFYAIMQARIGNYEAACLAIFGAMIMDIIDGRLARLTNTMSDFGSEYDSLSDMVSFGVAPALVLYDFALSGMGRFGSLVAFVYIACAALRLARFNVASGSDKRYFTGVPSPGAAAMIATVIWVCVDYSIMPEDVNIGLALLMVLMALAMVSNIKYRSFKDVDFRDQMPFIGLIILVLVIAMIYMDPPLAFLLIGSIYMISGAVFYASKKLKARQPKQ
ncbi:MAG: CDP-diacylglycerol--serine O-phosphatidyltransferase [Cryomorphaceae bacterium]|jgi:CDP-diacylglycerol--serine O-phosphatidyltransferase